MWHPKPCLAGSDDSQHVGRAHSKSEAAHDSRCARMGVRSQVHHPWLGITFFNHQGVGNAIRFVESRNPECVGKPSRGLEDLGSSNGVGGHIVIADQNNSVWIPYAHLKSFQRWPDPPWATGVVHHRQINVYPEDLVWLDPVSVGSASNDLLRHSHTHCRQPSTDEP